uniref:Uncharacterized protein n=1 Tax=Oryza brachyantha TaxID=4533 RepID=J3MQQ4_ORYBR
MASPMASLAATMRLRMARNLTVSASDFFLSSAWPRVAPASLAFTIPSVVTVGTTLSRCPCPAMPPRTTLDRRR